MHTREKVVVSSLWCTTHHTIVHTPLCSPRHTPHPSPLAPAAMVGTHAATLWVSRECVSWDTPMGAHTRTTHTPTPRMPCVGSNVCVRRTCGSTPAPWSAQRSAQYRVVCCLRVVRCERYPIKMMSFVLGCTYLGFCSLSHFFGSRFMARGSRLAARGSQFAALWRCRLPRRFGALGVRQSP